MDARPPKDIDDLFALLGGSSAVAKMLEVGQSTASEMRRRGSIPVRPYWDRLIGKLDKKGRAITLEDLHDVHRERPESSAPKAAPSETDRWAGSESAHTFDESAVDEVEGAK